VERSPYLPAAHAIDITTQVRDGRLHVAVTTAVEGVDADVLIGRFFDALERLAPTSDVAPGPRTSDVSDHDLDVLARQLEETP